MEVQDNSLSTNQQLFPHIATCFHLLHVSNIVLVKQYQYNCINNKFSIYKSTWTINDIASYPIVVGGFTLEITISLNWTSSVVFKS